MNAPLGYHDALNEAALFDFRLHGTLEAVGDDAAVFLHNLSTNDIKTLPVWRGCEAFFCSVTAKVIGQAWIWRGPTQGPKNKEERLWIDTPPGVASALFPHLKRHIIGEDVELTDHSDTLARFYLAGPRAPELLGAGGEVLSFTLLPNGLMIRRRDLFGVPGFDVLGLPAAVAETRAKLAVPEAAPETFDLLRVEAGLPLYGADISQDTFAPETGRILEAISYTKGCYLGQEPIVMARDRGVVQRSLVGLLTGDALLSPGTSLVRDGKEVGRTASSVRSPRLGQHLALAYVRRGSQGPGIVLEAEGSGARHPVTVAALPFVA